MEIRRDFKVRSSSDTDETNVPLQSYTYVQLLNHDLAECQAQLAAMNVAMSCAEVAYIVTDTQGRIASVSDDFLQLTGFSEESLLGSDLYWLVASLKDDEQAFERLKNLVQPPGSDLEFRCRRGDGDAPFDARVRIRAVPQVSGPKLTSENGGTEQEVAAFVAVFSDISLQRQHDAEHKQLQAHLAEAARRATAAAFTGGALQVVADALTNVSICSELVSNRLKTSSLRRLGKANHLLESNLDNLAEFIESDPQGKHLPEFLGSITSRLFHENNLLQGEMRNVSDCVREARELVEEQREYARVADFLEPVQLNQVVRDGVMTVCKGDQIKGIRIDLELDDDLLEMHADRRKVLQMVINLLANAKQAVRHATDPRILIKTFMSGDQAVLEVTDNGCGIEFSDLRHIFRRGFSKWKEGRGYGLFCSEQLADELSGSLSAHSEGESFGATFRLELPVCSSSSLTLSLAPARA